MPLVPDNISHEASLREEKYRGDECPQEVRDFVAWLNEITPEPLHEAGASLSEVMWAAGRRKMVLDLKTLVTVWPHQEEPSPADEYLDDVADEL
jgi:hypothetical protein